MEIFIGVVVVAVALAAFWLSRRVRGTSGIGDPSGHSASEARRRAQSDADRAGGTAGGPPPF